MDAAPAVAVRRILCTDHGAVRMARDQDMAVRQINVLFLQCILQDDSGIKGDTGTQRLRRLCVLAMIGMNIFL